MSVDVLMSVVSITRLRVRSWRYLPSFLLQTLRIAGQAAKADGSRAVTLLRDEHSTYWTRTTWSSEAAMNAFMHAKPHGPTMRKLLEWCDEAALVHWTHEGDELPSWEEAHRRLEQEGRRSKVHHPSAAHIAHTFPRPATRRTNQLSFKAKGTKG
jgi:Domain of unknown function (DUF3291)